MIINPILSLVLACCGLFAAGWCLGGRMRPLPKSKTDLEDPVDDAGLFCGWDGLSVVERKRRLALYQRRVRARIAEQERAWLQARLRDCAKTRRIEVPAPIARQACNAPIDAQ
ncbi:hypothetical protein [Azotobacter beijerinckii]|uniref:hypothetical protein n=1 Tax=Azotobacter beijerinckii TaxID=170623 RepID=UPI001FCD9AFA|nr:hypothetical protein [Azotobacter beijerinckii]